MPQLAGTFEGENFDKLVKIRFAGENFHGLLAFAVPKVPCPQILQRKLSQIYSHKTVKFAKVFSLESFPLYGTCTYIDESTCTYM